MVPPIVNLHVTDVFPLACLGRLVVGLRGHPNGKLVPRGWQLQLVGIVVLQEPLGEPIGQVRPYPPDRQEESSAVGALRASFLDLLESLRRVSNGELVGERLGFSAVGPFLRDRLHRVAVHVVVYPVWRKVLFGPRIVRVELAPEERTRRVVRTVDSTQTGRREG